MYTKFSTLHILTFSLLSRLNIRRDHLLEDAMNTIMSATKFKLRRSRLEVAFDNEEGFVLVTLIMQHRLIDINPTY